MTRWLAPFAAAAALLAVPASARAEEPAEFAARHILVAYKGAMRSQAVRTKAEAEALAQRVLAEVKAPGADFAAVSRAYSDDKVSDAQGGFLGIFERGTMTPEFQKAVEALPVGGLSGVVETPFGFHVVQRLSIEEATKVLEAQTVAFVAAKFPYAGGADPASKRPKALAAEDAGRTAARLRNGARFEDLPKEWDAQPLPGAWATLVLRRGTAQPQFRSVEAQAFALKVGEVSDPFDTAVGYVVLKRVPWWRLRVQHLIVIHKDSPAAGGITRTREEAQALAQEALRKYEADPSKWAAIVAEYSDEPGAGARAGSLGALEPGRTVPEFESQVVALPVGGHTQVFESPFGFHVARRVP